MSCAQEKKMPIMKKVHNFFKETKKNRHERQVFDVAGTFFSFFSFISLL